jgi:Nucleotidyltransferase domain
VLVDVHAVVSLASLSRPAAPREGGLVRHDVRVVDVEELRTLGRRLCEVDGVVAVLLGGSRARGEYTPESDFDLGLYYRPPLDIDALADLARDVAGPEASVTRPGEWGPWVDGGGWLNIGGAAVDWIYRDLDRVHRSWDDAQAGRCDFHFQVGHPLGVPDFMYAGEVALGVVLADPSGEVATLQEAARRYPLPLRDALVAGLWEASFGIEMARKAVTRGDTAYVAGCLFRVVEVCAHALHGHAGHWLINEKGAVAAAGRLPEAPASFAERAQGVLAHLGTTAGELSDSIASAADLLADTTNACQPSR